MMLVLAGACGAPVLRPEMTTEQVLRRDDGLVIVSTSTSERCYFGTTWVGVRRLNGVRVGGVALNASYIESAFDDRIGSLQAFFLSPGDYALELEIQGIQGGYYMNPIIGRFSVRPGELKYVGEMRSVGCRNVWVDVSDEWLSVRRSFARRYPRIDPDRVRIEVASSR